MGAVLRELLGHCCCTSFLPSWQGLILGVYCPKDISVNLKSALGVVFIGDYNSSMKMLVVYGGEGLSKEAEISQRSGRAVMEAAREAGFEVRGFELTKDNIEKLKSKLADFDIVFPALHGEFGEDGRLQEILDEAGVRYVGCGADASRRCYDKASYKMELEAQGILTPEWRIIQSADELDALEVPVVLKPICGGASIDMIVARVPEEFDKNKAKRLLAKYKKLLAEEYISGQEIAVGVLGEEALPVVEIIPPEGKWFDLESKYSDKTQENIPPQNVSKEIQKRAQELAVRIHKLMGCKDLSRTDMLIRDGQIYVLETNTMPGLTGESLYPKEARAAGYEMPELVEELAGWARG